MTLTHPTCPVCGAPVVQALTRSAISRNLVRVAFDPEPTWEGRWEITELNPAGLVAAPVGSVTAEARRERDGASLYRRHVCGEGP